jgi:hypothetical protein
MWLLIFRFDICLLYNLLVNTLKCLQSRVFLRRRNGFRSSCSNSVSYVDAPQKARTNLLAPSKNGVFSWNFPGAICPVGILLQHVCYLTKLQLPDRLKGRLTKHGNEKFLSTCKPRALMKISLLHQTPMVDKDFFTEAIFWPGNELAFRLMFGTLTPLSRHVN